MIRHISPILKKRLYSLYAAFLTLASVTIFFVNAGVWLTHPESTLRQADVIVVLGGGDSDARAQQGAELYLLGLSPQILLTASIEPASPKESPDISNRVRQLLKAGVPSHAIRYEYRSRSSYDEAVNTLVMMHRNGWQRAIVVSDPPHLRRLQLTWGRLIRDTGCTYMLVASKPAWWNAELWWHNNRSAQFVMSEYVKLLWYWLRYW